MVRTLRERAGLSQEALATRLGLAGKAVVSGWETGRTTCEGPAAELLMHLFAADTTRSFVKLNTAAETMWRRAGTWQDAWRQISAVPEVPTTIERETFAKLFPGAEIPARQHLHGFPFVDVPESNVFGIGSNGWSGSMPADQDRAPRYMWQLDRAGGFLYREVLWEELYESTTQGHTDVGSLLELAVCTTVFLAKLAQTAKLDARWRYALRIDLEGVRGRGIVGNGTGAHSTAAPRMRSSEQHLEATYPCSIEEATRDPVAVAYSLVGEILMLIRPDLASRDQLEQQLRTRLEADHRRGTRMLGMLDGFIR